MSYVTETLRRAATALAATGPDFFRTALDELLRMFDADGGLIATVEDGRASTLVRTRDGAPAPNLTFPLAGTACAHVLAGPGINTIPDGLGGVFDHAWLGCRGAVSYIGTPLYAPDQSLLGVIAVFSSRPLVDCDEAEAMLQIFATRVAGEMTQSRTDAALRASERKVFQMEKMEVVGRLAGGVAHDFNNMLTVILGYASELAADIEPGKRVERVREILKAAERSQRLTHQLLAIGRRQVLRPTPLQLHTVLTNLSDMLHRIVRADITLVVRPGDAGGVIHADPSQLEQVVLNLVANARDAMPGGGQITVATERITVAGGRDVLRGLDLALPPGRYVELTVTDTGHGMDEETVARVFEPFFTTKGDRGTGLGLATVHSIVQHSGATIQCSSRVGEGTRFSVYFPQMERQALSEARETPIADRGGYESVLVVEDEAVVRQLIATALGRRGYRVLQASTATEALALLCEKPDLILSDLVLPGGMSGVQLCAAAEYLRPGIATLLMSGYAEQPIVIADDQPFIRKPFTPQELASKIRDVLERRVPAAVRVS